VFLWPLLLAAVGIGVLWRQADEAQRERWRDTTGRIDPIRAVIGLGGWASYARIIAGVAFLVGAIVLFAVRGGNIGVARDAVIAALLAVLGVGLMIGPWLFRLSSDLTEERAERIRSQERADVAAHLHDSVLQTLALIQKTADDPTAVARLARAQERDLRQWLYTSDSTDGTTFAAALRTASGEVEDQFGVPVELVCVGDRDLPESMRPLVLAAREAMVNAAKHSGAAQVDVYAEVTENGTDVFVRDRGAGFEVEQIADDRHGRARQHPGPDGTGTVARPSCAAPPARAPRCGCTCRTTKGRADDAAAEGRDRRRPRDVPFGGPFRARHVRRRRRRGRGRGHSGRRGDHPPARRGAARRAPAGRGAAPR
jgi:signal transduction histidine kinase